MRRRGDDHASLWTNPKVDVPPDQRGGDGYEVVLVHRRGKKKQSFLGLSRCIYLLLRCIT